MVAATLLTLFCSIAQPVRMEYEFSERFSKAVQVDTGAAERAGRRGAEFDESFIDYAVKGHSVAARGLTMLRGMALRKAMPLHAKGADVESLTFFSDYRTVSGVRVPFTQTEINTRTGQEMNTLRWDVVEFNVPIQSAAFHPPVDEL